MIRLVALVLLLASASGVQAQSVAPPALEVSGGTAPPSVRTALGIQTEEGARLYAEGRAAALAFRLADARDRFSRVGAVEPTSPAGVYGLQTVELWQALVTEEDARFDRFYALNDSLTALVDGRTEEPAVLTAATAKLTRALAMTRQQRYSRAGLAFKDACGLFREVAGQASASPDALFGQGVCEVAAGSVPRKYRWLARLFGFSGNVASGMQKLDAAVAGGGALAVEATIALAIADASLNERRGGGIDGLSALAQRHPESPILAYLEGYHLLLDRRAADAEGALRRARNALRQPGTAAIPYVEADLGMALFRQDRFDQASELLEGYARSFRGRALVAQSTLHAGLAYEMAGDRRRAEALYRRVRAGSDYDTDLSAAREAAYRLEAPMTAADRLLLLGGTAFDSGRYDDAVRTLQPVVTDASLPAAVRAEAAYRTGRALQALEAWDGALQHFQLAADRPGDPLAKWGPWSVYHSGEVYEAMGQTADARRAYNRVLADETEFDYHKSLEQRARTALERIGR